MPRNSSIDSDANYADRYLNSSELPHNKPAPDTVAFISQFLSPYSLNVRNIVRLDRATKKVQKAAIIARWPFSIKLLTTRAIFHKQKDERTKQLVTLKDNLEARMAELKEERFRLTEQSSFKTFWSKNYEDIRHEFSYLKNMSSDQKKKL